MQQYRQPPPPPTAPCVESKMEHSYTRDASRPIMELTTGLPPTRTILVRRPPQCPSCHTHPLDEHDFIDGNQAIVPVYNEISGKEAMCECARIANYVKNVHPDDEEWEDKVNQFGWSNTQKKLFAKVAAVLDGDQLGRLANFERPHEPMQRRVIVDRSAARIRKIFASISWDMRLTQWLHALLMEKLPASYMASYLDILQTLKTKLPTLVDKMLFGRPLDVSQELLAPVLKKKWEPTFEIKPRKLSHNVVIVAVPSLPTNGNIPRRIQRWYQNFTSIAQIVHVNLPPINSTITRQSLELVAEQIVSLTRVRIQELRSENSARSIVLVGFNAGASLALQIALSENISAVVCMGFAFNTLNGVRGMPDDRILDIKIPILFVIGQNSARTSTEEIEFLREKLQSESSLVVVGSADDTLRVPKSRRQIENVTQAMVDSMVVDEMYEFMKKILTNPPSARQPTPVTSMVTTKGKIVAGEGYAAKIAQTQRKRKIEGINEEELGLKNKFGRPRTRPLTTSTPKTVKSPIIVNKQAIQGTVHVSPNSTLNEDLNAAMQTILSDTNDSDFGVNNNTSKNVTNFELITQTKPPQLQTTIINSNKPQIISNTALPNINTTKLKMLPSNQFIQLKPPVHSQSRVYTVTPPGLISPQLSVTAATNTSIGSIIKTVPNPATTGQQQIFTLKSPNGKTTQFVTAAPPAAQQKYTVVKNASGGTTLQLTTNTPKTGNETVAGNIDLSNIIDMPIVFADNDGNLTDSVVQGNTTVNKPQITTIKQSAASSVGQLIISPQIRKDGLISTTTTAVGSSSNFLLNKPSTYIQTAQTGNKSNKMVYINRNAIKPCPSIISRTNLQPLSKYAKVMVTNQDKANIASTSQPTTRANTQITQITQISGNNPTVTPIASAVKQVSIQKINTLNGAPRIVNIGARITPQYKLVGATPNTTNPTIVTNVNSDQVRNIIVKPGIKPISANLKTQLLNRNVVLRKFGTSGFSPKISTTSGISIVSPSTTLTAPTGIAHLLQDTPTINGTNGAVNAMQTSPKIITLNPINPSAKPE